MDRVFLAKIGKLDKYITESEEECYPLCAGNVQLNFEVMIYLRCKKREISKRMCIDWAKPQSYN